MSVISAELKRVIRERKAVDILQRLFGPAHSSRNAAEANAVVEGFFEAFDKAEAFERELMSWYVFQSIEDALACYQQFITWPEEARVSLHTTNPPPPSKPGEVV